MKVRLELQRNGHLPQGLPLELFWEEGGLRGLLRQENPALGELVLPFRSRLEGQRLKPLPLPPPSLRVSGEARPEGEGFLLSLEVELALPEGKTWGERAFLRLVEAIFALRLERTLSQKAPLGV
ncbi:DUF3809 family protein [Thermus sp.]|jgi:hypothetical protein|uniref:DUF3809 family protein n=1 Tax=Thermus sp. TaxID=275 RepID=UPI0032209DFC